MRSVPSGFQDPANAQRSRRISRSSSLEVRAGPESKTAQALGLTIPESPRLRADRVISMSAALSALHCTPASVALTASRRAAHRPTSSTASEDVALTVRIGSRLRFSIGTVHNSHWNRRLPAQATLQRGRTDGQDAIAARARTALLASPLLPYTRKYDRPDVRSRLLCAPVMAASRYGGRPIYFTDVVVRREDPARAFSDPDDPDDLGLGRRSSQLHEVEEGIQRRVVCRSRTPSTCPA